MATSLQQLLDDLTATRAAASSATGIEDVSGALGHFGRALTRLAQDGLTPNGGPPERTAARLGTACATVGALWPAAGGTLTDLAGAAADLVGRARDVLGRSHRWAITVELAERADHCARLGRQLLPRAAPAEFSAVRRLAAAVEHAAQQNPPTPAGCVALDRLVPMSGGAREATAVDAFAGLVAALDRGARTDQLALRDLRAVLATGETTSRYVAAVTAAATGAEAGPLLVTAVAWQLASRISMAFEDGRRTPPTDPRGVLSRSRGLADQLHAAVGTPIDITALRARDDLADVTSSIRQVANGLPVLAEELTVAVHGWARTGQLYAYGRDLPQMEDMPEDRVRDVIAGRRVQALGADLDRLGQAVSRAGALSTALADALNQAAPSAPTVQRHMAALYAQRTRAPGATERLLEHAQAVERALAANRTPLHPGHPTPGGPPLPGR